MNKSVNHTPTIKCTYDGNPYLCEKFKKEVRIESREFWFRIESFLQQNWALIDATPKDNYIVFFISDVSGVFDETEFTSSEEATDALIRNGFKHHSEVDQKYIPTPEPPFYICPHRNGQIYSSGRYWI